MGVSLIVVLISYMGTLFLEKLINLNTTNNLIEKDNTDKQVKYKKSEADRGEVFYQ